MVNEFQKMINLLKLVDEQHRLEGEDENEYSRSILAEVIGMLQKCEQCNVSGALPFDELVDAVRVQLSIIKNLTESKRVVNLDEAIAYYSSLVEKYGGNDR